MEYIKTRKLQMSEHGHTNLEYFGDPTSTDHVQCKKVPFESSEKFLTDVKNRC